MYLEVGLYKAAKFMAKLGDINLHIIKQCKQNFVKQICTKNKKKEFTEKYHD